MQILLSVAVGRANAPPAGQMSVMYQNGAPSSLDFSVFRRLLPSFPPTPFLPRVARRDFFLLRSKFAARRAYVYSSSEEEKFLTSVAPFGGAAAAMRSR